MLLQIGKQAAKESYSGGIRMEYNLVLLKVSVKTAHILESFLATGTPE